MSEDRSDPFCWAPPAVEAHAAPIAVPARHTRRWALAGATGVLAALAAAAALLLAGGGGGGALPFTPLARAADVTTHVPGFKFTLTMDATVAGQGVAVNASGEFNSQPLNGSMTMTADGTVVTELFVPPYAYLQIPFAGPGWKRLGVAPYLHVQSLSAGSMSGLDPQELLSYLRSVGSVTTVGQETVDGASTTHYHALVDLGRLAASLPPDESAQATGLTELAHLVGDSGMPIDAWVDAQERVRRLTIALPIQAGGQTAEITLSMDLYDYAAQAAVSAPPAADVTDLGLTN